MLPEHSSRWGAVTLIYCLWICSSIAAEFMGSFCSLTMQNEAVQGGWMGRAQELLPFLISSHLINLFWPVGSAATEQSLKTSCAGPHTVPWQYSLWLIMCYKIIHQKGLNVWQVRMALCVTMQLSQFSAGDWSTDFGAINAWFGFFSSAQALTAWKMDRARGQSCSDDAVLPLQAAPWPGSGLFVLSAPQFSWTSLLTFLLHRALSPSWSETAPSHELSFCVLVWLWPFLFKDSKGKPCTKALHNHGLFTQSLCAQIILLNNDSSLYLQRQGNLPLFASGNFLPKASTGGGVCFYST